MLRHTPRARRAAAMLIIVLIAIGVAQAPASADGPLRLEDQLTDKVGALGDRRDEAQAALDLLRKETGLQLFVAFVRSFDGTPAKQWADETAVRSDLGDRDAVLAVATVDRSYAYSFDDAYPLADPQLAEIAAVAIEPALAQNDWAGAVVGAAEGYRAALAGAPVPTPKIVPGDPDPGGDAGGAFPFAALWVLVAMAVVALGLWLWWRARRRAVTPARQVQPDPADPRSGLSTQQLADRANSLLIELDDALRTSERELSMATDQYGEQATASFVAALDEARREVAEAFRLRMLLDEPAGAEGGHTGDAAPAEEVGRRRLLGDIIRHCESADARLDAESDAFDELRELEAHVEQSITTLGGRHAEIEARLPAATAGLDDLRRRYVGQALTAVAANLEQANDRLRFATAALGQAADEVAAGRRPGAALAVRAADQALDQAEALVEAIGRVGADLNAARAAVDTLLTEVDTDLAAARTAHDSGDSSPDVRAALAAAVAGAEHAAAAVRAALAGPTMDPLSAVRQLEEADGALDRALAAVRDAAERTGRARAVLDQAILAARAEISAATDFITTRRGAIGGQARTLLAEAQRHLHQAVTLAADDPVMALAEAQQADRLAEQAGRAAQSDVSQWAPPGGFAGGRTGGGMDVLGGLAGAVLGGILIGGGGRHGHTGFGGGWGGHAPGGFGGHAPGGFGGSSRRGGGGRF